MGDSSQQLATRALAALTTHEGKYIDEYAKPMGAFAVRFSGAVAGGHVGKAVDAALDRVLAFAPPSTTFRGVLPKGGKSGYYKTPRKIEGAGRKLITTSLASVKTMPKNGVQLYLHDGKPEMTVPNQFAAYVGLSVGNRTEGGMLMFAFPLDALEDPKWIAAGDEIVVLLGTACAWMGPAMWLAPSTLFIGSLNRVDKPRAVAEMWRRDPHIDIPSYFAGRWPFELEGAKPGLYAPGWVMWGAGKPIEKFGGEVTKLRGITRYQIDAPPCEMTEATYAIWKRRWEELAPLRVEDTNHQIAKYYCARFGAATLEAHGRDWIAECDEAQATQQKSWEIQKRITELAKKPGPALLEYAGTVKLDSSAMWYFLPALRECVIAGHATPEEAIVWLDLVEQLGDVALWQKAAEVATAAGALDRAIELLERAVKAGRVRGVSLKAFAELRPLRKHKRWAKLVASK